MAIVTESVEKLSHEEVIHRLMEEHIVNSILSKNRQLALQSESSLFDDHEDDDELEDDDDEDDDHCSEDEREEDSQRHDQSFESRDDQAFAVAHSTQQQQQQHGQQVTFVKTAPNMSTKTSKPFGRTRLDESSMMGVSEMSSVVLTPLLEVASSCERSS
jgi:hypothetical protein